MRPNTWLLWPPVSAFDDAILSRIANGTWLTDKLEIRRTKAVLSAGVNWDSFLGFFMNWRLKL